MEYHKGVKTFYANSAAAWRRWLQQHHRSEESVWLIMYNKGADIPTLSVAEAVEQALCFGWIDSKANKRDAQSRYQLFARRNPKSNWSGINKERVERLTAAGKMKPAGLELVRIAKENGSWNSLDAIEKMVLPADLSLVLATAKKARANWDRFPPSARKAILTWIASAKTDITRQKRIKETVRLAGENRRANQYTRKQVP